jgi:hypothetical protein
MKSQAVAILLLSIWARSALGVPYWPEIEGAALQYNDGTIVTISSGEYLTPPGQVGYTFQNQGCTKSGGFGVDDDGDIYTIGGSIICNGWFDADFWGFGIPVKFLDLPLYPAKTWSNTYDIGFISPVTVSGRVDGFGTLTTPVGNLYYYEVQISGISYYVDGVYWINEHYGPVRLPSGATFVGATGIVSSEVGTWGSVKALYR